MVCVVCCCLCCCELTTVFLFLLFVLLLLLSLILIKTTRLSFKNRHVVAWQSQVGPLPWMGPQTGDVIKGLGKIEEKRKKKKEEKKKNIYADYLSLKNYFFCVSFLNCHFLTSI